MIRLKALYNYTVEDVNSMKKSLLTALTLTSIITLGACSSTENNSIELDNGNEPFLTATDYEITKQEVINEIGTANSLSTLLDLVDFDILSAKLSDKKDEIDAAVAGELKEYKDQVDEFEEYLALQGFESEEDFVRYLELNEYRMEAVSATIEVTDEEIQEAYDEEYTDKEDDKEESDEETPSLEDVRAELEEEIIASKMTNEIVLGVLADTRRDANITFTNEALQTTYVEAFDRDFTGEVTSGDALITTDKGSYTMENLYDETINALGLSTAIGLLDNHLLATAYSVKDDAVKEDVDYYKVQLGESFYPYMEQYGLYDDEAIFEYFRVMNLQEAAFQDLYPVTDDQVKTLYDDYVKTTQESIAARHILVATEEEANELLAELEKATDKEATFKELAVDHSTDGSAAEGGDLGAFAKGDMVKEFEEAAFALETNTYTTKPVKSQYGYHLIFRYAYEPEIATYEEKEEELKAQAESENFTTERLEKILMDLRDANEVTFTDEALQERYEDVRLQILDSIKEAEKTEKK